MNLTDGGEGATGWRPSEEQRAARSGPGSVLWGKRGPDCHNFGLVRSPETRQKLREAVTGTKYSPERLEAHLLTRPRGERVNTAKLTEADVLAIMQRLRAGEHVGAIADDLGLVRQSISRIKSGQTWSHLPRAFVVASF